SLVLAGKGFRPSVNLVLYRFWDFIIGSSDVIALPAQMNAQPLPYDTLFKKIDLFIVQSAVTLCVLLDVFQREGNVGNLVVAHACACVGSGLVAVLEVGVNVYTIGSFTLNFHIALIERRTDRAVIHHFFNDTDTLGTFCPVLLLGSV